MKETIGKSWFDQIIKTGPYAFLTFADKFSNFHPVFGRDETQCIEWTGSFTPNGYGRFTVRGKELLAHRVSFILYKAELDGEAVLRHSCDNHRCINPNHLTSGTQQENVDDMLEKGRHIPARGEQAGLAKLTHDGVLSVFEDYKNNVPAKLTAVRLGVRVNHIYRLRNGKRWGHING